MKVEGPDDWTDTSLDWTRTDTSFDNSGERKKGPSFRNMTKQDYLSLYGRYNLVHTFLCLYLFLMVPSAHGRWHPCIVDGEENWKGARKRTV